MGDSNFEPLSFILDDKELLNEFEDSLKEVIDKKEFVKKFAFNLLKAKYFLDNYIVHHSNNNKEYVGDNPWQLQYFCYENSKRYPKNLADTQVVQDELVHLLSMFEVSFTPKQRKNYLFYCMMYLFENSQTTDFEYLYFLQSLAHKYFFDVYLNRECLENEKHQPGPNAFDKTLLADKKLQVYNISYKCIDHKMLFNKIYEQGRREIPLFVFNYTDYIIWKKYAMELRGKETTDKSSERRLFFEKLGCSDFGLKPFVNFYFSRTRKSLEHYYPQAKAGLGKPLSEEEINCFGNFAMIGAEINSSGSDLDPITKITRYCDSKADPVSIASLKFKIMMQICQDNNKEMINDNLHRGYRMEWSFEDMQEHQKKMLDIIIRN